MNIECLQKMQTRENVLFSFILLPSRGKLDNLYVRIKILVLTQSYTLFNYCIGFKTSEI